MDEKEFSEYADGGIPESGVFFIPPPDNMPEIVPFNGMSSIVNDEQIRNVIKNAFEEWMKNPLDGLFNPTKKQARYM